MSDENLVRLAQQGDGSAFAELLSRHYDLIFRLSHRFLGSQSEAEDLAQDICVALPAKLQSFRGESQFKTWLYRVTCNAAKDCLRRNARLGRAQQGWGDLARLQRDEHAEAWAEMNWLKQAMDTLSEDLRETVALVLGEELTHAKAGEALGVSEGTVSWRMSQVKKNLRVIAQKEERL